MQMKQTQKCQCIASALLKIPAAARAGLAQVWWWWWSTQKVPVSLQKVLPPAAPDSASSSRNNPKNESSCPSQAVPGHCSQTGQSHRRAHANVQAVPELSQVRLNQSTDYPPYTWDYLCPRISKLDHHLIWNEFCLCFTALTRKAHTQKPSEPIAGLVQPGFAKPIEQSSKGHSWNGLNRSVQSNGEN